MVQPRNQGPHSCVFVCILQGALFQVGWALSLHLQAWDPHQALAFPWEGIATPLWQSSTTYSAPLPHPLAATTPAARHRSETPPSLIQNLSLCLFVYLNPNAPFKTLTPWVVWIDLMIGWFMPFYFLRIRGPWTGGGAFVIHLHVFLSHSDWVSHFFLPVYPFVFLCACMSTHTSLTVLINIPPTCFLTSFPRLYCWHLL